ncbi:MAG TPA: MFS transporter [Kiritimatiellia bacterium]|nr:MFS transporter [Kiritimatiellia bacterium]
MKLVTAPPDARRRAHRTLGISVIEGSFTTVFMVWTSGAVLTGYLLALGAGPRALAAAASLPLLVQIMAPLLAWLGTRLNRRVGYLQVVTALGRGLWILAVFLPWIVPDAWPAAWLLVALIGLSGFLQSGVGPAWVSLMADVVPNEIRGRYFGFRNSVCGVIGMAAGLAAGVYLDRVPSPGGFQMLISIGLLFALIGIVMYGWHEDPHRPALRLSLPDMLRTPFRDPNFRRFLAFSMYWNAAVMLGSPFVFPYFIRHLGMSFTQLAIFSAIAATCGLFTMPLWGRLADQVGHKTVMGVTLVVVAFLLPGCWILAAPGFLVMIWISGIVDAVGWGGFNIALFNLSLNTAPARYRIAYMSVLGACAGLTGCITGLLSGPLLEALAPWTWSIREYTWTGYHSLFLISALLRGSAWFLLRRIPEPRKRSLGDVLREYTQRGFSLLLQSRTGA